MKTKYIQKNSRFYLTTILSYLLLLLHLTNVNAQGFCETPDYSNNSNFDSFIQSGDETGPFYIKIYIHVIRDNAGQGGHSLQDVEESIAILQQDFNPHEIFFAWDGEIDFIDNNNWYSGPANNQNGIYTVNNNYDGIDIYLFPDSANADGGKANGVGESSEFWVSGTWDGNIPVAQSHIISHEMGHVLNLWHTHHGCESGDWEMIDGSNCEIAGDFVCDTPSDPHLNFNVNSSNCEWDGNNHPDCSTPEPISNYMPDERIIMAYTNPNCMAYFTLGQGERMRNSIGALQYLQATVISTECPDPNQLTAQTQDEDGNNKTTFCYGEDIWLNGYIPDEDHQNYFLGVYQHYNFGNNDYTGSGCEFGWMNEQFDGSINMSILKDIYGCDFDFEPGSYLYKIVFAYDDPCTGWKHQMVYITIEECYDLTISDCSLDSYNITNDCFLDAEVTIENLGTDMHRETEIRVFLSKSAQYNFNQSVSLLHFETLDPFMENESLMLNFELEIPHDELDICKYYIIFYIDFGNEAFYQTDIDGTNNTCHKMVKNCPGPVGPGPIGPGGSPTGGILGGAKIKAETPQKFADTKESFTIYPNPTFNELYINLDNTDVSEINITNTNGQTLASTDRKNSSVVKFDVSDYPPGLYLINTVDLNGEITNQRFVKK